MRLGTFQFLDRLPGRVSAKVNASAHCPRKRPDTRGLRPRRIPELARAFEPTLILRAGRLHRPAAQPFVPPLRPPIVPPLLVLPQIDHPCGPTVSPRATGLLQLEHRAPLFQAVVIPARKKAGAHPARPTQRRQAAALHALPRLPGHLRGRAAFGVRPLAGAVGLLHCCRKPTAHPYLAGLFHARTYSLLTRRHCPPMAGLHRGAGRVNPLRQHRPEDSEAPRAELLAPQPARWPVASRTPNPPRSR